MSNITNCLNKIKTAIYGKDVRGAIHDAIKQVYEDASVNHDNANMEVKLARGTHDTLNDRLVKSEQKLDETNAQLSVVKNEKASKDELNVERKRIDNLSKLEIGSTTGDAELIDGRVGNDGEVYDNIGSAIRSQTSQIKDSVMITKYLSKRDFNIGGPANDGSINVNNYILTTSILNFPIGSKVKIIIPNGWGGDVLEYDKPLTPTTATSDWNYNTFVYKITKPFQRISLRTRGMDKQVAIDDVDNFTISIDYPTVKTINSILNLANNDIGKLSFKNGSLNANGYYVDDKKFIVSEMFCLGGNKKITVNLPPTLGIYIAEYDTPQGVIVKNSGWKYDLKSYEAEYDYIRIVLRKENKDQQDYIFSLTEIDDLFIQIEDLKTVNTLNSKQVDAKFMNGTLRADGSLKLDGDYMNYLVSYNIKTNNTSLYQFNIHEDGGLHVYIGEYEETNDKLTNSVAWKSKSFFYKPTTNYFRIVITKDYNTPITTDILKQISIIEYYENNDENNSPFINKCIGFGGDSITFGYDQDNGGAQLPNPWVKQVGAKLEFGNTFNYGVSSGSVIGSGPKVWYNGYVTMSDELDYVGMMIGINDAYRGYTMGTMEDRTSNTFYGGLHLMWQGLLEKYPPKDGKKLFMITYPKYDVLSDWGEWDNAMREVADYYSIPICDLNKNLGVSPYMDNAFEYWREEAGKPGKHNAHPTQLCANAIADCIANFIATNFSK